MDDEEIDAVTETVAQGNPFYQIYKKAKDYADKSASEDRNRRGIGGKGIGILAPQYLPQNQKSDNKTITINLENNGKPFYSNVSNWGDLGSRYAVQRP